MAPHLVNEHTVYERLVDDPTRLAIFRRMALRREMGSPRRDRNPLRRRRLWHPTGCNDSWQPCLVLHVEAAGPCNHRVRSPSSRIRSNGFRKIGQAKPGPPRFSTPRKNSFQLHRIPRTEESDPYRARLGRTPRDAVCDTAPAKHCGSSHYEHFPHIRLSSSTSSGRKNHSFDYQGVISQPREHRREYHGSLLGAFPGRRSEESLPSLPLNVPGLAHASELQTDERNRARSSSAENSNPCDLGNGK